MINPGNLYFIRRVWFLLFLVAALSVVVIAQKPPSDKSANIAPGSADEKSEQIIKRAIEVLGGASYLNVRNIVGRGFFTSYLEGVSQIPAKFVDYIIYPDRERTEFIGAGIRTIQTNVGDTGWLFDGATKTITDQKGPQIEEFKRGIRTSLENLLRGGWRQEGGRINYIGRREAGLAKRNETLRITYPDGFWIEYEFGAKDGLPAKVIYKRTRTKADSDEKEEITEEDRLAKPITVQGITAPWVVDHYINDVQTSRISYESLEYNQPLPDSLFAKPANIKALK